MKTVATFLFGSGWSVLWHALHWLLLLPIWGFYAYARDFKPGAGPQGGEFIFMAMVLYGLVVFGLSAANALHVISTGGQVWWLRFMLWPLALFVFPLVAMFLGFAMFDAATDADFTPSGKLRIAITLPVLIVIYYGLNFGALASARAANGA